MASSISHRSVEYNVSYVYHAMYAYFDRDNVALKGLAKYSSLLPGLVNLFVCPAFIYSDSWLPRENVGSLRSPVKKRGNMLSH